MVQSVSHKHLRRNWLVYAASIFLGLSSVLVAVAAENARRQVVSAGGTSGAQSATHRVSGTLGQWAAGRATSAERGVRGGFWGTLDVCFCPHIGDLDTNNALDIVDIGLEINVAFRGAPVPPGDPFCPSLSRADLGCDGYIDIVDVTLLINAAFRNTDARCNPCEQ